MRLVGTVLAVLLVAGCPSHRTSSEGDAGPAEPGDGGHSTPTDAGQSGPVSACLAPAITPGLTIEAASGDSILSPALAAGSVDVAVAYYESGIHVQRLTPAGAASGTDVLVASGAMSSGELPTFAFAATPAGYVACSAALVCSFLPTGSSTATMMFAVEGSAPSLAYGPGGLVLAYLNFQNTVTLQRLSDQGGASGSSMTVIGATGAPVIIANAEGFSVGSGLTLYQIDLSLGVQSTGPLPAGWSRMAASGATIGLAGVDPDSGAAVFWNAGGGPLAQGSELDVDGGTTYSQVGLAAAGDGTYAASWSAFGGYIGYRAIDALGAPVGSPVQAIAADWDDNGNAIILVRDGFLLAGTVDPGNDKLVVVHLGCP
jgi:hypothetical protein